MREGAIGPYPPGVSTSQKPVPRELHPHTIPAIRLRLRTDHHAAHRHARYWRPRGWAGRDTDHGKKLRAWFDTPRQPHVETASAEVIQHRVALEWLPVRVHTAEPHSKECIEPWLAP